MSASDSDSMSSSNPKSLTQVLAELKSEYLLKMPEKIEKLKSLTNANNWPALEEEYHNLKGTGKTYGYPEVSLICEKLEVLIQQTEFLQPELFHEANLLLERLYQSYSHQTPFDLHSDATFKKILAHKANLSTDSKKS